MRRGLIAAQRQQAVEGLLEVTREMATTKAEKEKAAAIEPPNTVRDPELRMVYRMQNAVEFLKEKSRGSASSKKKSDEKSEEE